MNRFTVLESQNQLGTKLNMLKFFLSGALPDRSFVRTEPISFPTVLIFRKISLRNYRIDSSETTDNGWEHGKSYLGIFALVIGQFLKFRNCES